MAIPKTIDGAKVLIQIGDGASPTEAFAVPCGLTGATVSFAASAQEEAVHDCAAPENAAWVYRQVDSLSMSVSGTGLVDTSNLESVLYTWWASGASKNCRVKIDTTGANGGGYWAGSFVCTSLSVTGERKQRSTVEIEIQSNGPLTWTDAT